MTTLETFLKMEGDGVFYIGHASSLVRINDQLVLFDPVWNHKPYGDYWYFEPDQIDCDGLPQVDSVVISHIHEDHVCDKSIEQSYAPVRIMAGRPNLFARLDKYNEVTEVEPFEWTKLGHLEYYFVPHAFNSIDSSCFVRSLAGDYCVYVGSDNFLSKELIERIKPDIPEIDVAMVPYAFVHWYPGCMNMPVVEKIKEVNRLNQQSLDQAQMFVDAFKPKITIPFGNNLRHVDNDFLNEHLAKPEDFKDAIPLQAGDWVIGNHTCIAPKDVRDRDFERLCKKVAQAGKRVMNHTLIVNDLWIDLDLLEVRKIVAGHPLGPCTEFKFRPMEFRKWYTGEITFEQAIGTRQFICTRVPNEYNLEVFEWFNNFL